MRFGELTSRSVLVLLLAAGTAMAQESQPVQLKPDAAPQTSEPVMNGAPPVPPTQPVAPGAAPSALTPEYLQQLTGTIALYPDPLVAQILPASTFPTEIVMAARMVERGASPEEIDRQSWDPSVKAIAHYPTVIKMMSDNLEWTAALGDAFMKQPADVMASIQVLRVKAKNLGNLVDTPQQKVLLEEAAVRIVPAVPDVVYVPVYQPSVVYYNPCPVGSFFVGFGVGWAIGTWCNLDCNWWGGYCYRPWGWNWCGFRCGVTNINCGPGTAWNHNAPAGWGPHQAWSRDLSKPLTRGIGVDRAVARPPMAMDSVAGLTAGGKPTSAAPGTFNGGMGGKPMATPSGGGGKPVTTPGVGPDGAAATAGAKPASRPVTTPGVGTEGVKPAATPSGKPGTSVPASGDKMGRSSISRPAAQVLTNGATVHAPTGYSGYGGKPAGGGGEGVAPGGGGISKPVNAAPGGGGAGSGMSKPISSTPAPARFSMPTVPGASHGDNVSMSGSGKITVPSTAAMSRSAGSVPAITSGRSGGYSGGGYSGGGGKIMTSSPSGSGWSGSRSMGGGTYSGRSYSGGGFTSRGGGGFSGGGGMRGGGGKR